MSFSPDSTWICQFPISLAVEGKGCYQQMARAGVGHLLFCSVIYAPYRLAMSRYPQKGIYSMEEGMYHFIPEKDRYRNLPVAPTPSADWNGRDMLAEAVDGVREAGISPGAWVSVFANGLIAKSHPSWAVQNLFRSADRLFLCQNNPEVREYSLQVCGEIAERYAISELMLDKIPQLCVEIDALGGVRIDPVLRTLASFCFCPGCVAAAGQYGIDLEVCRRRALEIAARCLAIPPHVVCSQRDELKGDMEIPLLLLDEPWVTDILRFRNRRHAAVPGRSAQADRRRASECSAVGGFRAAGEGRSQRAATAALAGRTKLRGLQGCRGVDSLCRSLERRRRGV